MRAACAPSERDVWPHRLVHLWKRNQKNRDPLDGVAPWRQASETSTRWDVLGPVVQAHLQTWEELGLGKLTQR